MVRNGGEIRRAGGQLETVPAVGDVLAGSAILLTVSCCLRQPRIVSGGTLSFVSAGWDWTRFLEIGTKPGLRLCG